MIKCVILKNGAPLLNKEGRMVVCPFNDVSAVIDLIKDFQEGHFEASPFVYDKKEVKVSYFEFIDGSIVITKKTFV